VTRLDNSKHFGSDSVTNDCEVIVRSRKLDLMKVSHTNEQSIRTTSMI